MGYGTDIGSADANARAIALIFVSMFVELAFEFMVDVFSLSVEWEHGIDLG